MSYRTGPKIVTDDLVLCLDAGDRNSYPGSGSTWYDLSGNSRNATLKNSPSYNQENLGNFSLNGSNHYAYVSSTFPVYSNFTASFWIKINTTSKHRGIFVIKNASESVDVTGGNFAIHTLSGGYFGMEATNLYSGNTSRNNTVINNSISYCTVVCDQSNLQVRYYLNGILDGTQAITSTYTFNDHNALFLGCRQYTLTGEDNVNNLLTGKIYVYQYYYRALSANEVQQNYNATKGRFGL